jgi:hypothetical protein
MAKYLVQASWSDVPHLTEEAKRELAEAYPPYQRDARMKGIPQLGSGAVYQYPESELLVADFEIPDFYPRAYGLDVGWNRTAAVWGARDNSTGCIYLYAEYYRGQAEPVVHVDAIRARGKWIPGVIDPASAGRSQKDGVQLLQEYREMGLDVEPAVNAVEAGIYCVWTLMSSGRLKVFKSLINWLGEFRLYQRDMHGVIKKENDHLLDATRYLCLSGRDRMRQKPQEQKPVHIYTYPQSDSQQWMGS